MRRLMFVVNVDWFFVSHRLPIAIQALAEGYEVHIACQMTDQRDALEKLGVITHPLTMSRGGTGIYNSCIDFFAIYKLLKRVQPNIVHLVTIKSVLLGGIAARLAGIQGVVAAISGLGFVFMQKGGVGALRRKFVEITYRLVLGKSNLKVIFQNPDDCNLICEFAQVPFDKVVMIRGSGVDLKTYKVEPPPEGVPVVMLAARLLRHKGVFEFVETAKYLRTKGYAARFCLVGDTDLDNPSSVTEQELASFRKDAHVELWGHSSDMPSMLAVATIVVLPSYREGLPKVLIEAAACGRAVITTDVPGCRDAIESEKTGLLVPARDTEALSHAIAYLLDNQTVRLQMGNKGRELAEREYDVRQVIKRHIEIYQELESNV